ncbi:serine/threonine protein kinase PRR1 PWA37_001247 [Arxiozyma heterogenica]|uniref:Protein kinase domain-containing protein n=1 Tax=Arxiozyma heterogenica TaxID=278026 RepID=A0AAN7WKJ0_9SACH|nr:hypothetical protein RI543_003781 [Kazachstania heterogenica]
MVNMNFQQAYAEYLKGNKEKPKTPQLQQLNTDLDIHGNINNKKNNPAISNSTNYNTNTNAFGNGNIIVSPQNLPTPQFDNIRIFPTPISYLPSSPMQGLGISSVTSPILQHTNSVFEQQQQQQRNQVSASISSTDSILSEINIKKRRDKFTVLKNIALNEINHINIQHKEPRNLDELLKTEHRIVSELVPAPDLSPKRISSLPTVSEELSFSTLNTSTDINNVTTSDYDNNNHDNNYKNLKIGSNIDILNIFLLPNFDHSIKFNRIKQIGKGNFSVVDLYENIESNPNERNHKLVAIKKIIYPDNLFMQINNYDSSGGGDSYDNDTELFSSFESSLIRELSVLQKLDHPCIIKLYGINNPIFLKDKTPLTTLLRQNKKVISSSGNSTRLDISIPECDIVMSYCLGGDLLNALAECNGGLEVKLIQRIFTELSLAVKYLHDNLIIHRDLKLENILLVYPLDETKLMANDESRQEFYLNNNIIQLTDFGLSKQLSKNDELCTTRCGSEDYVSPEILMGLPYDGRLSDSWAMGVILYALLEDRLPFDPPVNATLRQRRRATSHRIAGFEWRWNKLKDINMPAKEIVSNTLTRKNKRWDINNIIEFKFVSDLVGQLAFI